MKIEQFECLLKIAEVKSIQKAAEEMHMSIQNTSRLIKQLEEELNTQIFIRDKKCVLLTSAGEDIYKYAQSIVNAVTELNNKYIAHSFAQAETPINKITVHSAYATNKIASDLLETLTAEYNIQRTSIFIRDAIEINRLLSEPSQLTSHANIIMTNIESTELLSLKNKLRGYPTFFLRKDRIGVRLHKNHP